LTPATLKKVNEILGTDGDLAGIANWADQIRLHEPKTAHWHFVDIPIRQDLTLKDVQKFCANDDCVINQIKISSAVLRNPTKTMTEKNRALKFLVHFVGDMHQPLHCADDDDRGGNDKLIRFQNEKMRLHALWDGLIEKQVTEKATDLATQLSTGISGAKAKHWMTANESYWAFESYIIGKTAVYAGYSAGAQDLSDTNLGDDYFKQMRPL
jgi:hypothetical protein